MVVMDQLTSDVQLFSYLLFLGPSLKLKDMVRSRARIKRKRKMGKR
jgi:hypothetical protein